MTEVYRHKYHEEEDDEDLGYLDNIEAKVTLDNSFNNVLFVDNIPKTDADRTEKLKMMLSKLYSQCGQLQPDPYGVLIPADAAGKTQEFCLIEFIKAEDAEKALTATQGYVLDKQHIFRVTKYEDIQKYLTVPDTFVPPQIPEYQEKGNLRWWLQEPQALAGNDQYAIQYMNESEIYWNNPSTAIAKPDPEYSRTGWTDTIVTWSPNGTYIATYHSQGIIIWGGKKWDLIQKFGHPGVKLIDWSPSENYLITFSPNFQNEPNPNDPKCIIVWEIKTGRKMRGFPAGFVPTWPNFTWSYDDKYCARLMKDPISVYETPSMDLVGKNSLSLPGVTDFAWSPSDHYIAYWIPPEKDKQDAAGKSVIVQIPTRKEVKSQIFYGAGECKLFWQSAGEFLCVKVDRMKSKKTTAPHLEFFRTKEKGIPFEILDLKEKEMVFAFQWEPRGTRFAIVHGEQGSSKPDISIYDLKGNKLTLLKTLEKRAVTRLAWSPQNGFLVFAGFGAQGAVNGALEFFNANDLTTMANEEHFMATDLEWDPTGRYLATWVNFFQQTLENGYNIWTFHGKLIRHVPKEKFNLFTWRPRPQSLLPREKLDEIKKNIKNYQKQYEQEDREAKLAEWKRIQEERERLKRAFQDFEKKSKALYDQERPLRIQLRHGYVSDDEGDYELVDETVEEVVETKTELV